MYVKIHPTEKYGGNTGSSHDIFTYLSKEDDNKNLFEKDNFFNQNNDNILPVNAQVQIDNNVKGLKKSEDKFYMVSINPSERELKHMAKLATGGRNVKDISKMSTQEINRFNSIFRGFVNNAMHDYAAAFNRKEPIKRDELVYYCKIEHERTYKGFDKEVLEGKAKSGQKKPGLQSHCHIVVSRNDKTQKKRLSPLENSKGTSDKHKLNGKTVYRGFNRDKFKEGCEKLFDRTLGYERNFKETYKTMFEEAYTKINQVDRMFKMPGKFMDLDASLFTSQGRAEIYKQLMKVANLPQEFNIALKALKLSKKVIEKVIKGFSGPSIGF